MKPRFLFRPEALAEVREAWEWYAAQSPGLELEFARAIDATIAAVGRFPEGYPIVEDDLRRAVMRRFPYQLVYFRQDDMIVVVACWHFKRRPQSWSSRR
jgi:toxin ParE1/3/4